MHGYNFTERVRQMLARTRDHAVSLQHEYVGTEHILLAMLDDSDGTAMLTLQTFGVDRTATAESIRAIVKRGTGGRERNPNLPYTSRAKKVLELAMTEARRLQHSYVGSEHLLLGLLAEEKGVAAQVLNDAGVTLDSAREAVLGILGTEPLEASSARHAASLSRVVEHVTEVHHVISRTSLDDQLSGRFFLRHALATLAYRGGKALRGAPESFATFRVAPGSRTPGEILAHLSDLLNWALSQALGKETWNVTPPGDWDEDVARFHAALAAFDAYLAGDGDLRMSGERLFQGAIADALTHVGQLTMLRRLASAPIRGENYSKADIQRGRLGPAQTTPDQEFD